jgi:hypothetical protein
MRAADHQTWHRNLWKGLVAPWRDRLPLREQRVRHLILSDWLEEWGKDKAAQIIREGVWWLYVDRWTKVYTLADDNPRIWDGPFVTHWWPRSYSDPAPISLADLGDAMLDSELWTPRTVH